VKNNRRAELAGPSVTARKQALQDWVYKYHGEMTLAGVAALELHADRERTGASIHLSYLSW
jgi:hypothetical protein